MIERDSSEWWDRAHIFEENVKQKIEEFGWTGVGVFPTEEDDICPFTYTVGFTELDQPEVIIYGIPNDQAHMLLWRVYDLLEKGFIFEEGELYEDIFDKEYKATFRAVPGDGIPANVARVIYGDKVKLLQLVWPDDAGYYPWEGGWDCKFEQPVLADEPGHADLRGAA